MKICDLYPSVRPYERLESFGASSLSDEELVAIVLRSGTKGCSCKDIATNLISNAKEQGGVKSLITMPLDEISRFTGVGRVKAIAIKASIELGRRAYDSYDGLEKLSFSSCEVAKSFFERRMAFLESEEFHVVNLDTRLKMISCEVVSRGGLDSLHFLTKEVFRSAVRVNAAAILVAHNHPSGDPTPGDADIEATHQLMKCAGLLGIDLIDHVVVGRGNSVSMRNQGFMEDMEDGK